MSFLAVMFGHFCANSRLSSSRLLEVRLSVRLDSVDRALGHAHPAVDTLVGMDNEHVLALVEAVDGAHRNAIGGLALDAPFIDDVGQLSLLPTIWFDTAATNCTLS